MLNAKEVTIKTIHIQVCQTKYACSIVICKELKTALINVLQDSTASWAPSSSPFHSVPFTYTMFSFNIDHVTVIA